MAERTFAIPITTGIVALVTFANADANVTSVAISNAQSLTVTTTASEALVSALIEKDSGVVGGSARIARTRIPIWTLENFRRLGATHAQMIEMFPALRPVDLAAARSYAAINAAEIEGDIEANASAHA